MNLQMIRRVLTLVLYLSVINKNIQIELKSLEISIVHFYRQ